MSPAPPSTRRDTRYRLRPGSSCLEYASPEGDLRTGAQVVAVSNAGLAFLAEGEAAHYSSGDGFENVMVRIGGCVLHGDLVVRNAHDIGLGRVEVGCLFYPRTQDEERWATLLAGIEVATPIEGADG